MKKKHKLINITRNIIIGVKSGCAFLINNPFNDPIEVRDYDVQEESNDTNNIHKDEDGDFYGVIIL